LKEFVTDQAIITQKGIVFFTSQITRQLYRTLHILFGVVKGLKQKTFPCKREDLSGGTGDGFEISFFNSALSFFRLDRHIPSSIQWHDYGRSRRSERFRDSQCEAHSDQD